jgi:hypothetical protein
MTYRYIKSHREHSSVHRGAEDQDIPPNIAHFRLRVGLLGEGVIAFGRAPSVKGRGSGSSRWLGPSPGHRDTHDTKSMAGDIGTKLKGRMVALAKLKSSR